MKKSKIIVDDFLINKIVNSTKIGEGTKISFKICLIYDMIRKKELVQLI